MTSLPTYLGSLEEWITQMLFAGQRYSSFPFETLMRYRAHDVSAAWLRKWRTAVVAEKPDLALVPARVFEYAAEDLERAWKAAQRRDAKPPRFDRFDPQSGGFAVDGVVRLDATRLHLPRIGPLRVMPHRRSGARHAQIPADVYARARIVKEHGEWFAVLVAKAPTVAPLPGSPTLGLDWGVRKLATLSDGTTYENPRALDRVAVKAEKTRQSVARKIRARDKGLGPAKKGETRPSSHRLRRARIALGRQLRRAAHIRADAIHHVTKTIAARDEHVAAEKLTPRNMTRRRVGKGRAAKAALNRRILDAAPGLFLRTLDYKLAARGLRLTLVPAA